jgi:two-component system, cell cycle response regulator
MHKKFEELKQSGALPTPSGVGLVILRRTQDEDCALGELVECIQVDPALSGRLLKLANSAAWQGAERATTIHQAATRLGTRAVRGLALSFTLVSSNRTGNCRHFDYDRYWSYSLACATAAQVLAGERGLVDPAEAFTCALLSRIGMLALATVHPDGYSTLLEAHRGRDSAELLEAETREFDIQHWEVTAAMMSDWGMPDLLTAAVLSLGTAGRDFANEDPLTAAMSILLREASQVADAMMTSIRDRDWALGADWVDLLAPSAGPVVDRERLRPVLEQAVLMWREWGTTFRIPTSASGITIPAEPQPASTLRILQSGPSLVDRELREEIAPLAPSEIKVLAIDDDPRILRLLSHHLKQAGYQVRTAENGEAGLQIVLDDSPHIVVTDWVMPELSGIELCRALRRIDAGRRTYVLILTARDDEQQVVDAFGAGADDFVTKPFNPRILIARVQAGQRLIELQRQVEADKKMRMRQVAEMGLITRKLRAAALTDVLTDLPNRRYALTRLEQEWTNSERTRRPLSVVMIDIDHFKKINDTYGHDVGDIVLKQTADVLRARTRRGDVVCRLGGEEFLVINVNSDMASAVMCAERLRTAVESNVVTCEGYTGRVTVSLGCAERTPAIADIDDLLKASDEAVYAAKAAGRNQTHEAQRPISKSA